MVGKPLEKPGAGKAKWNPRVHPKWKPTAVLKEGGAMVERG